MLSAIFESGVCQQFSQQTHFSCMIVGLYANEAQNVTLLSPDFHLFFAQISDYLDQNYGTLQFKKIIFNQSVVQIAKNQVALILILE